ncbi:FG-GAP-like repeat-containing protein, partial [Proteiniphilum saccharofermentans]|uniref:FG-GAP-like repeat-containing protein n=1 Tax=Proteiniphilum saccharofermentans TaxID=1642647 RepID=UPI0028AA25A2
MKTFYTLNRNLPLCLLLGINLWVLPGTKAFCHTGNDTIPKTGHIHVCTDESCDHVHYNDSGFFVSNNLYDKQTGYTIEPEVLGEGDTLYHYRFKGFVLDDIKSGVPALISNADKVLKNKYMQENGAVVELSAQVMSVDQSKSEGKIDFTEGVTPSGGKFYSIPVPTAPVASSAPQIALTYNSQAGNGVAGYGWNISGLSAITASGKSVYYDNVTTPLDLSKPEECTFYLDGTRLIPNTGSLTDYHYETAQGFVLVKKHMYESNIAYFSVAYPDGRTATFGFTDNMSMRHIYPLTEIKDLKGYLINYEYKNFTESGNNYYVSHIRYGGKTKAAHLAEIRFNYETRTDYTPVYVDGTAISAKLLLKSIVSYNSVNETNELRTYSLAHVLNNVWQLTRIDCKTGPKSLNPLQFTYEYYYPGSQGSLIKETEQFLSSYFASGSTARPVYVRGKFIRNRFNDGLVTFPGNYSPYTEIGKRVITKWPFKYTHELYGSNCSPNQDILIAPGLSFISQMHTIKAEDGFQTISAVDVNGDGVDEIVKVNFHSVNVSANATVLKITIYSTPSGTISSRWYTVNVGGYYNDGRETYSPMSREYFFGDFKGDGKMQLLTISHNKGPKNTDRTSIFSLIDLNTGSRIYEGSLFSFGLYDGQYTHTIDVNGDGKTELCYASSSGWKVYTLSGTSFTALPFSSSLTRTEFYRNELIGDLNGDGMADILIPPVNSYQDRTYAPIPVWAPSMCYNCGTPHPIINEYSHNCRKCNYDVTNFVSIYNLYCNECNSSLQSCQGYGTPYNVDDACCPTHGRSVYKEVDLGYVDNGNTWTVYLSTGKGHVKSTQSVTNAESGETYFLMDVNGDGKSDLLRLKNNRVRAFLNKHGIIQNTATGNEVTVTANSKILPANVVEFRNSSHFITIEDAYVKCYRFTKDEGKDKLLTGLTDSYGMQYMNDYSNMVENDNYITSSISRSYPFFSLIAPLNLLRTSNIYMDNYRPVKQYYYTWYGAVAHKTGLGFSGFEKVKTIEYVQNITVEEERDPLLFGVTTKVDSPFGTANYYYTRNEGSNRKCNPRMTSSNETDKLTGVYTYASYQYDTYNNPTKITLNIGSGSGITRITDQTYDNIVTSARYLIGQPLTTTVTNTRGGASWIHKEAITYNSARLPATRITYTGTSGTNKTGETRWTYDTNGNVTSEKSAPYNVTEFLGNTYTYDPSGRYIASVTNALLQKTDYSNYDKYGNPKTIEDHKSRITTRVYNEWGQLTSVAYPDGTSETTEIDWGGAGLYTITHTVTGQPATVVHYDALGREIRKGNQRFDGSWQYVDNAYDNKGRLEKVSLPFKGSSPSYWNTYTYDTYDRPTNLTEASGKTATWNYNGLSVTETRNGIAVTKTADASGALISVSDPGGTITYTLRPDGQPSSITAPGGVITSFGYDAFGRQTSIADPSAGTQTFSDSYTSAGVLTRTVKDANGKIIRSIFKRDGRIERVERPEFTTSYVYKTTDLSLLEYENSTNGTRIDYTYDSFDRVQTLKETVPDGKFLQKTYAYATGNVSSVQYETQNGTIGTENFTYAYGHNTEIKLNNTTSIWKLTEENALGQPTRATTGTMARTYGYTAFGLPTGRTAGSIQSFTYNFDVQKGNLLSRKDNRHNKTETFGYDHLNRLSSMGGQTLSYAANGNITQMPGVGTLAYGNTSRPYQVTMFTPTGTAVPVREQSVTYTSYQRPNSITENGFNAAFTYNAAGDRVKMQVKQNNNVILSRYYIGKQYELDVENNIERLYLGGDAYSAPAVYVKENGSSWKMYYICRDYLGSITHIANSDGSLKAEYSYDAWGRLRNPATHAAYA